MNDFENRIIEELQIELGIGDEDMKILEVKVRSAIRAVKTARNYQSHHTDEFIQADIKQFESQIRDIALYDFNQIGAEGQISHNENSISRTWKDRRECFAGIVPFAKSFSR